MSSIATKDMDFDTWIYCGEFHEGLRRITCKTNVGNEHGWNVAFSMATKGASSMLCFSAGRRYRFCGAAVIV